MIIFLYGPDSYRRLEKQKEIIAEYRKKHSNLTRERFYLDEEDSWQRFKDFVLNQSLFGSSRLAVISHLPAGKELVKILKDNLESENLVILVLAEDKPPKILEFLLKRPVISQFFNYLTGEQFKKFALDEAGKRGIVSSPAIVSQLALNYKNNSWGLITELEKMALGGTLPQNRPPLNLWKTLGFLNLANLERLLGYEDPAKIFNLLILRARPKEKIRLADYDVLVKSGRLDYEEALLDFVIK